MPMSKVLPLSATGNDRETDSQVTPEQRSLRFGDPQRVHDLTRQLSARLSSAITELGGLDWAAVSLGRKLTYASKLSEALNLVDQRRAAIDVLLLALSQGGEPARELLAFLCDVGGCEAPRAKRVVSDAEIVAAFRAELDDSGPVGRDLAKRVAERLGVDVASVRR